MALQPVVSSRKTDAAAVSDEERQIRIDLAACYRLIAFYDMDDMFATHISARVPGPAEHFLLNPLGLLYTQVTASNLVKVDLDGNIVGETQYPINPAGFVIHSAVHAARPDVTCVLHTHTVAGMAVASLEDGLLPLTQKSLRFYNRIGYHDYEGVADDLDERSRIVRSLTTHNALILRNHGLLTCGKTIAQAFMLMRHLEKSCQAQLAVMSSGGRMIKLSPNLMEHAATQFEQGIDNRVAGWPSLLTMLDGIDPGYRN